MTPPLVPRLRRLAQRGAAGFSLYVGINGLAGFILARQHAPFHLLGARHDPPSCWPELGLFDDIGTRCPSGFLDFAWYIALGPPREVMIVTGLGILFLKDLVRIGLPTDNACALLFLAGASMLILRIYVVGVGFWRRQSRWIAIIVAMLLAVDYALEAWEFWL